MTGKARQNGIVINQNLSTASDTAFNGLFKGEAGKLTPAMPGVDYLFPGDPNIGGGLETSFVLNEDITAQKAVQLMSDGKIEGIKNVPVSQSMPLSTPLQDTYQVVIMPHPTKSNMVIAFHRDSTTGYAAVKMGVINPDNTIVYGSSFVAASQANYGNCQINLIPGTNTFLLTWQGFSSYGYYGVVGTINADDSFSFGASILLENYSNMYRIAINSLGTFFLMAYSYNYGDLKVGLCKITGSVITIVSMSYISKGVTCYGFDVKADPVEDSKFYFLWYDGNNTVQMDVLNASTTNVYSAGSSAVTGLTYTPALQILMLGPSGFVCVGASSAVYGTRSVNALTFQNPVTLPSATLAQRPALAADPNNPSRFIIAFCDSSNSNYGNLIVGMLTGTTLSFATKTSFNAASILDSYGHHSACFIAGQPGKFTLSYKDTTSNKYEVSLGQLADFVSNLDQDKVIGILAETGTTGQTKKVYLQGGLAKGFVGLTIGYSYYLQTDGTISTSGIASSVFLGKAISSTTILLKSNL